jgi:outer membrane protein assembly factor BamB
MLYALTTADGSLAPGWPEEGMEFSKGIWATPIVRNGTVYVATMEGRVHALNTSDGSPAWDAPFEGDTGAIPELALINDEVLFVPTLGKKVYLLDAASGRETQAAIETTDWVWTTPAVRDSTIYFGDFSGVVHAVDITTGSEAWTFPVDHKIKSAPVLVGDTLVVADRGPGVTFIDIANGQQVGNRVPLPDAGTVRADVVAHEGAAYILTTNGKLFRAEPDRLAVVQVPIAGAPD